VLSGYVIERAQINRHRDMLDFAKGRLRRLLPLYLVAVALSIFTDLWAGHPTSLRLIAGHLAFLQYGGSASIPPFYTNGSLWSLSYEFYFYFFYALTIGRRQRLFLQAWWCLAIATLIATLTGFTLHGLPGHFQSIVALSPVWLLGTTLARAPLYFNASWVQNAVIFSFIPLVARSWITADNFSPVQSALYGLLIAPLLYSLGHNHDFRPRASPRSWAFLALVYVLLALLFWKTTKPMGLPLRMIHLFIPFLAWAIASTWRNANGSLFTAHPRLSKFVLASGAMSYAVYVIHVPIISLLRSATSSLTTQIVVGLLLIFGFSWFLEFRFQPFVLKRLARLSEKTGK
jgi:peptidoglycan/LPS O-acetylase OafA/YrhL